MDAWLRVKKESGGNDEIRMTNDENMLSESSLVGIAP
jgi:hypothetical protein